MFSSFYRFIQSLMMDFSSLAYSFIHFHLPLATSSLFSFFRTFQNSFFFDISQVFITHPMTMMLMKPMSSSSNLEYFSDFFIKSRNCKKNVYACAMCFLSSAYILKGEKFDLSRVKSTQNPELYKKNKNITYRGEKYFAIKNM